MLILALTLSIRCGQVFRRTGCGSFGPDRCFAWGSDPGNHRHLYVQHGNRTYGICGGSHYLRSWHLLFLAGNDWFSGTPSAPSSGPGMSIVGGVGMFSTAIFQPIIGGWIDSARTENTAKGLTGNALELATGQHALLKMMTFLLY